MDPRNSKGFTLLELLLVIGIIALITVVAVPNFKPVLSDAQLEQSVQFLQADLMKARQIAKGREDSKRCRVEFSDPNQYDIELETDTPGTFGSVLGQPKRLADGCSFDPLPTPTNVTFDVYGQATGASKIVITNKGSTGTITVNGTTGRVEVSY